MKRQKQPGRELQETSWLAQVIADKMEAESGKFGLYPTSRWNCLHTLLAIVNEADDPENDKIYYDNCDGKRQIIICDIPSLVKHGTDFDREGMRNKLSGMAEKYKDDEGMYLVHMLVTHDLNSAVIKDVSGLLFAMAE
jgi:hypothetical protein